MTVTRNNKTYDVYLVDDGTLDTCISVDGVEIRFDHDYAAQFRNSDGSMPASGLRALAEEAIEDGAHLEEDDEDD